MKHKKYITLSLAFAFALGLTPFSGAESTEVPKRSMIILEECIQIALDNNLPLRIAEKQLKLAKFRLFEAERKIGPSITVKIEDSCGSVYDKKYTGRKILVEGKQPVFYGGELVFSVEQANYVRNRSLASSSFTQFVLLHRCEL